MIIALVLACLLFVVIDILNNRNKITDVKHAPLTAHPPVHSADIDRLDEKDGEFSYEEWELEDDDESPYTAEQIAIAEEFGLDPEDVNPSDWDEVGDGDGWEHDP